MWLDQFEFAGFYLAKEKGFYKELGLDVEFKKFTYGTNLTQSVLSQNATFGLNSSSLIIDKANGADIVFLSAIFQSSPLALLALKDNNIENIEDIKNKKVMLSHNQEFFATTQSLLASKHLKLSDIQIVPHTFNIDDLINKKVDLMSIYTTNEPYVLKEKGYEGKIFHPKDYGFDFYEDILFTSKTYAQSNPEIVENFRKASIKGWEYALNNIEEVAQLVYSKYNSQNKSLKSLIFEANEIKKLVYSENKEFGDISIEKLRLIQHTYRIMGLLKKEIKLEELIYKKPEENTSKYSNDEEEYLKNKQEITMCIDPDWMPFEKIENGEHIGISKDYIKLLQKEINIPITLVKTKTWLESLEYGKKRKCDIFSLVMNTPERRSYLDFSEPYFKIPLVIASNLEAPFIDNIMQVKDKKLGLVKGYAFGEILRTQYPNINFIDVDNIHDGLNKVRSQELFAFIDSLATVGYHIQKDFIGELKISGKFDQTWELSIGTRNDEPLLKSIFDKAINTITEDQERQILNKWISVSYEKSFNYDSLNKKLLYLIGIILLASLFYRQYLLKRLNKRLNDKVKQEIEKNNQQHQLMNQQAKMASMGEMIGNIAHQWRQPLSLISVTATGIKFKKEFGNLSDKEFNEAVESINDSAQFLSKTIDDFRNFYDDNKTKSSFYIKDTIEKTFKLISAQFTNKNITIIQNIENIQIRTIENELLQVLMNILSNAQDALDNLKKERMIFIDTYSKNDHLIIEIKDNANGIDHDILPKIFDPYFTTKHQAQGTGIGLYMSQQMIVNHMEGQITVRNEEYHHNYIKCKGAVFTLEIPLDIDS